MRRAANSKFKEIANEENQELHDSPGWLAGAGQPGESGDVQAQVSQVPLELYDNFNGQRIDPSKWHGIEVGAGASAPNSEAGREIDGKRLQLYLTTYGASGSDSGSTSGSQRLRINNPAPVKAFQAEVTVRESLVEGSSTSATQSGA